MTSAHNAIDLESGKCLPWDLFAVWFSIVLLNGLCVCVFLCVCVGRAFMLVSLDCVVVLESLLYKGKINAR